ncbi:MAG: DUF3048 domain-containing protein [Candidatus Magasanikbacteria bacterium]|nr:DUF3048 domain-containing protein [Candidatus Magasanikbacteria bacterium]
MHKKYLLLTGLLVIIVVAFDLASAVITAPQLVLGRKIVRRPTGPGYTHFSKLNGSGLTAKENEGVVLGAMIDNNPEAWEYQARLSSAKVVYEALAEGGITRYLALFTSDQTVYKLGPIRSARPYYIDWLREYGNPLYLHSGGSPVALEYLKNNPPPVRDVNEFYWGKYYWRDKIAIAPHDLFTSSSLWQSLLLSRPVNTATNFESWKFATTKTIRVSASTELVGGVILPFTLDYSVAWKFNKASSSYERFINDEAKFGDDKLPMSATTVIVQFMPVSVLDAEGRREFATVGSGNARILFNGQLFRGSWKKPSVSTRTKFYDANGSEIVFPPGKMWVEVVPESLVVMVMN